MDNTPWGKPCEHRVLEGWCQECVRALGAAFDRMRRDSLANGQLQMADTGPQPQLEIDDEVRVVFDHRSRRWQLTMLGYSYRVCNCKIDDIPREQAKALKAEQAAKAI